MTLLEAYETKKEQYKDFADVYEQGWKDAVERYRWHDLIKNPNDLPPNETEVIAYDGEYNLAIYDHEYKHWYDSREYMELRFVKAWREIETFKGE